MKKLFACFVLLVAFVVAGYASADKMVENSDCNNSPRNFATIMCPDGYRVQGVAYSDLKKNGEGDADMMDAVGPVCRHVVKGNDMLPSDFNRKPATFVCDKKEIMIGVAYKDIDYKGNDDAMDGITAVCYNPTTKAERIMSNGDIDHTKRSFAVKKVYLPNRVTGIAYKDKGDHSDKADCATVMYKYQPIVGE